MRTDDSEDIKPHDTREGTPDVVEREEMADADENPDDFSEFDAPPKSKSLGDVFRESPFIKIVLVLVGILAVVTALIMFGGKSDEGKSDVGVAVTDHVAPGQENTEAYRTAVEEANQQRLADANRTGESTMPIPTAGPEVPAVQPQTEEPPVTLNDPLDSWRTSGQEQTPQQVPDPLAGQQPAVSAQYPQQQAVAMGPDPAAVDALAQAMGQQMQGILAKHDIKGSQIITVTERKSSEALLAEGGDTRAASVTAAPEEVEILIPAGTIVYAQTLTEANTDAPGPVLARISSGPLRGSRIIGTFESQDEYLTLNFNTVVVKGVSQSVNAVALDPKTTLPAVATEVDHRYWRRFILPAAARFISGMGDAISQRESTTVSVNGSTVTSSKPDLNTKEELAAGLAEGTQEIGDQLDEMGSQTKVMIKVHAGTPIGILFLDPVVRDK